MFKYFGTMNQYACGSASQQGSALIIALVFLLAMTLIGVTAMQGSGQQESMAGNYRDRALAFQSAEAALVKAGVDITKVVPLVPIVLPGNAPVWDNAPEWWTTTARVQAVLYQGGGMDAGNAVVDPRYVIQDLGPDIGGRESVRFGAASGSNRICQVTARGTGASDTALVILVATYGCVI